MIPIKLFSLSASQFNLTSVFFQHSKQFRLLKLTRQLGRCVKMKLIRQTSLFSSCPTRRFSIVKRVDSVQLTDSCYAFTKTNIKKSFSFSIKKTYLKVRAKYVRNAHKLYVFITRQLG